MQDCPVMVVLPYYTTLHYTTLHYTILYYTILYYTILYYTTVICCTVALRCLRGLYHTYRRVLH